MYALHLATAAASMHLVAAQLGCQFGSGGGVQHTLAAEATFCGYWCRHGLDLHRSRRTLQQRDSVMLCGEGACCIFAGRRMAWPAREWQSLHKRKLVKVPRLSPSGTFTSLDTLTVLALLSSQVSTLSLAVLTHPRS